VYACVFFPCIMYEFFVFLCLFLSLKYYQLEED
jgi:hypothetical protein